MVGGPKDGRDDAASPGDGSSADPVGGLVADVVAAVAGNMERDLDANSVEVRDLLEAHIPRMRGDRHWADLLRSSIASNVETMLHALRHGIPPEGLAPPAAAAEYARRMAQHAVPMEVLARAYRMGLATMQDEFLRRMTVLLTDDALPAPRPVDPATILDAVRYSLAVSYRYVESVTVQLGIIYDDERHRWETGADSARAEHVRRILVGADPRDAAASLRYDLERTHLAAVLWLPETTPRGAAADLFEGALRTLGGLFDAAGPVLAVASDELSMWVWFPLDQVTGMLLEPERIREAWDAQGPATPRRGGKGGRGSAAGPAVSVALGTVGSGLGGFRRSHEHAVFARTVAAMAQRPDGAATAYEEPGLSAVAMLCTDTRATARWVAETLGPLAARDDNAARLRETLRMFYLHGASHKSAASALHLHPNTVKYRIRRAEELLGRPLPSNRGDIELAVSISYWLGDEVLTG